MTGQELFDEFKNRGFNYSREQIFNLYISLMSKPFVILSGISGSGKSKVIEILAEIISEGDQERFELVPVKPNWRDSRFIFGFHNLINGSYNSTPILNLIIRAHEDPSNPYFLILDEMNLAKVEQYFADFLSLLETRRYSQDGDDLSYDDLKANFSFPPNTALSEAIVMSCLHSNPNNDLRKIENYRNDIFSLRWKEQFSSGSNWTAQFRSELNQKDAAGNPSRLAGKLFVGSNGTYKLRDSLPAQLQQEFDGIKHRYETVRSTIMAIVQQSIQLHSQSVLKTDPGMDDFEINKSLIVDGTPKKYYIPSEIILPLNLFVVGTVNMDETTHMFSPKVLDRANVIEMNEIDLHAITNNADHVEKGLISQDQYYFPDSVPFLKINLSTLAHTKELNDTHQDQFKDLFEVNKILKQINRHFGYRVYNEISNYILKAIQHSDPANVVIATDIQILQKILPKLHGSAEQLYNPLMLIFKLCFKTEPQVLSGKIKFNEEDFNSCLSLIGNPDINYNDCFKYPRSAKKLKFMISDLLNTGFTSFIQ
jgi:energy-coupling factor transporter ATP-binding protein EcfA2